MGYRCWEEAGLSKEVEPAAAEPTPSGSKKRRAEAEPAEEPAVGSEKEDSDAAASWGGEAKEEPSKRKRLKITMSGATSSGRRGGAPCSFPAQLSREGLVGCSEWPVCKDTG